jgi:hypothetical protein
MRTILAPLLAAVSILLAVAGSAGAGRETLRTGLFGTVREGPTSPVCIAGEPCTRPAVGAVLTFSRGGTVAGRVTVKADGSYRIRLAAGWYTVRASRRRLEPATVHVRATRPARIDFSLDTGIR